MEPLGLLYLDHSRKRREVNPFIHEIKLSPLRSLSAIPFIFLQMGQPIGARMSLTE
jgi:hypothetical protein